MGTMIKLSETRKLDGIKSWSLEALATCPGSVGAGGKLVPACQGCYATQGAYRWPQVKAPRIHNREDWKRSDFVLDFVRSLKGQKYFRWFDSGDAYALGLAEKMLEIMRATPETKHWFPTRMAKFSKFSKVLADMEALPNVKVRFSSDSILGEFTPGLHGSTILHDEVTPPGVIKCMAYANGGKCSGCRACYSKSIQVIGYPAHGAYAKRVIKIALAA